MRLLHSRRLAPGEVDHEMLWLCVSLGGLALAAAWMKLGLPWPRCAFHEITGYPCVTCGATRSAIQFFQGNLAQAWSWNPLVLLTLCAITAYDVYAFVVLVLRLPRLRLGNFTSVQKIVVRLAVAAGVLANWAYVLTHVP